MHLGEFIGFGQGRVGKMLFKQQNNKNLCYCWHREWIVQTSSFWREGGWRGEATVFLSLPFFFKGVGSCINRMTELFAYDIYLQCDVISSHTDVIRSRAFFSITT